ncbi:MAG: 23S rRNA (guanosine(2251)-2'-O)-methyltransferase RlmB [Bacteroidales bacterium]|nr:23S rRNA (guanosine(2251)-2'-O)-methyltransferase RlmB [Bacteroidales bacterium]
MDKESFIYGLHPVAEAIKSGKEIDRIFFQKGLQGSFSAELLNLAKKNDIPFQFVPKEKLDRITRKNHQGVIALLSGISYEGLESLVPLIFEQGKIPFLLILDGITDVRNFGAICRSAECAGVHGIVIPMTGSAQVNEEAIRTSAGALLRIPVCREKSLPGAAAYLKDCGIRLVGATEHASTLFYDVPFIEPLAIVMGSEEKGISRELAARLDHLVQIPMQGTIASLNVSVAAGILLFEVVRQRASLFL